MMRERGYFLTQEFVSKLHLICKQRPEAAYYDMKMKRLTVNDMELFGLSVKQVDNRSLLVFLKRLKSIGFRVIQSQNVTIYEWSRVTTFQLSKQISKTNQMISNNLSKRKIVAQNLVKRKEYVDSALQKLIFKILINRENTNDWHNIVESTVLEVQNIIKTTALQSIEAVDQIQKIQEQQIYIYKNLIANQSKNQY